MIKIKFINEFISIIFLNIENKQHCINPPPPRMFGLTNFVMPNILKTKILHLSMDRIWISSCKNFTCIY